MRIFSIAGARVTPETDLPLQLPTQGFLWVACSRSAFEAHLDPIQAALERWCGRCLVDLHVSDLLNAQLPSHFDYSAHYDLMVFRRLATPEPAATEPPINKRQGPPALQRLHTSPVGFAVFDRILISVHPDDCAVRDAYAQRLLTTAEQRLAEPDARSTGARGVPTSPADMMLRIISHMVDGYLDLRRILSRQLDHWQTQLLNPRARFVRWEALLQARAALHQLESLCDDQRTALLNWGESLNSDQPGADVGATRDLEMLKIRNRDVLEHIDRVAQHVRRLEHNTESAVQMHFNVQSNRTNDIMRTLTSLTAIFLPLNLIAAIFGMNFEFIPWLHQASAFWWTLASMGLIALSLVLVFWRKRYLAKTGE